MTVIKRHRTDNFAVIPNEVANDDRLSFEARGLLVYLLAKPDDWQVSITDLRREGGIGKNKVYLLLNQLIEIGYIERKQLPAPRGRRGPVVYHIYDLAVRTQLPLGGNDKDSLPLPENGEADPPLPRKPLFASPVPENRDAIQRMDSTKITPQPPFQGGDEDCFQQVWAKWPIDHRGSQTTARREFRGLSVDEATRLRSAVDSAVQAYSRRRKGRFPALARFIAERTFEEFHDCPEIDPQGHFRITRKRLEWDPWVAAIRARFGRSAMETVIKLGYYLTDDRWPPTVAAETTVTEAAE